MATGAFASILRGSHDFVVLAPQDDGRKEQKKPQAGGSRLAEEVTRWLSERERFVERRGTVPPRHVAGAGGLAVHGQKLRCARKIAATTFWSLTRKFWVGSATAAFTMALPPKPLCRLLYMISTPRSKFLTGFQIVREPTCQKAKSGEQLLGVNPAPLPRLAKPAPVQISAVAAAS